MERILTIQDVSCVGKCSLTVALPIISAFGVETSILPTAVLSTHTAFNGFTFRDLTSDIEPIYNHWLKEGFTFKSIYTGYLGSLKQISLIGDIFDKFKTEDNFILVDPVMADNGNLYTGFDQNFADNMAKLCAKADVIVPNLTEASFMLHEPYVADGYNEEYIKNLLIKLTDLGCKIAVLTGVSFKDGELGVYGYDKTTGEFFSYFRERIAKSFHGTGDVFASSLCGAMTTGNNLLQSLKIAVDYTVESINLTVKNPDHNWYGVEFEKAIPYLVNRIKK